MTNSSNNNNNNNQNKGEGNPEADKRYRESTREFVKKGKVEEAAQRATNMTDAEKEASRKAEAEAESHKRG